MIVHYYIQYMISDFNLFCDKCVYALCHRSDLPKGMIVNRYFNILGINIYTYIYSVL